MGGECFTCATPASAEYTLVLYHRDGEQQVLEGKVLCDQCAADLREVAWVEVTESPVLVRGGTTQPVRDE